MREAWESRDPDVTQVNWDELYYVNRHGTATPASYAVGGAVTANRCFQFVSSFEYRMSGLNRLRAAFKSVTTVRPVTKGSKICWAGITCSTSTLT